MAVGSEQTIFTYTLTVNSACDLFLIAGGKQGYSNLSGSKPWQLTMYYDGTVVNWVGGSGAYTDSPALFATVPGATIGNHTIKLTWYGDSSMTIQGVNMMIYAAKK